ncbi:hypothetical protein AC478_00605 [miscellaneous Crenarchaeota group-1 archaeon SG8-32-3]|uniref:Uncharacterized protein n=1 Tax=miscellaneous Crenarchaeota group-1 archaeon SG8-32-3 TaxID=1685125 RepID=A0A0M0BVC2_9ARCH|nr:MAG: hypothetical protein AC478_00605 [miscellaneous Crenarchaeota group-1 archaeon SG8-32-3]
MTLPRFNILALPPILFTFFFHTAVAGELDIQWQDNKLSIKAKGATVCEILKELAEKTNTKIRNDNPCDNVVNLNIEKKSFDEAIKKILKHDSYVLVDDDTERKLLVYNRKNMQQGNDADYSYSRDTMQPYIPEPAQPDATFNDTQQHYEQYQDPSAADTGQTMDANNPDPIPSPSEPPFAPDTLENAEGVPIPDPNEAYQDPMGGQ